MEKKVVEGVLYECTGYEEFEGKVTHDGDTCPIHEDWDSPAFEAW